MGQDSHRLQDNENISPAHHWYCSYGRWRSRPRVWPWSWTRLFLVKREIWTWNCCCVCECVLFFSSSHLSLKKNAHQNILLMPFFSEKIQPLTPDSTVSFGHCSDGPLCLKPALRQDGGDVAASTSLFWDHYFFFVCFWLSYFQLFFSITNTTDPVEKTFCFTGNKKIIYASVKCKKITSPLQNQASLEFTETNSNTHSWLLYFCTPLRWEDWKDSPNRQNQFLCTTFQVLMNKRWNWQPCLSLSFCPRPDWQLFSFPSAADVAAVVMSLLLWTLSCLFVSLAFFFFPKTKSH